MDGFHHGHHVFGIYIGQDIMHLLEDESPSMAKN